MPLSDIIDITISSTAAAVTQAGFGIPLILSANADWVERVRSYATLAEVDVDFQTTDPEYLAAAAMFAQDPAPDEIKIGRLANAPTQRWNVTIETVANNTDYTVYVDGIECTVTSDGTATNDEIVALLVAEINSATTGVTASAVGAGGSQTVRIVADNSAAWYEVYIEDLNLLSLAQDHADPGVAADLTAIQLENDEWYAVYNPWNSQAMATAIAAWVETAKKLFVLDTQDTECITVADGSATDVMKAMKTAAYARTAVIYHPVNSSFIGAAWLGACLPLDPGSETWKFKTLAGVDTVELTSTHRTNANAKYGNFYYTVAGVNITSPGKVAANEWIDTIRFKDWLEARLSERIFSRLAGAIKIPYTDAGVAVIEAEVRAQLKEGVAAGGLAATPEPEVTVPLVADVSDANKSARLLPDVTFTATLAGAIHTLEIDGTISV